MGVLAGATIGTILVTEDIVILVRTNRMLKIIYDARHGGGKILTKFRNKFKNTLPADLSETELAQRIVDADEKGVLCDGSLRKPNFLQRKNALKNKIIDQRELANYLKESQ